MRWIVGFAICAALVFVIGYAINSFVPGALIAGILLALALFALGACIGLRSPGKKQLDALWGKSRSGEESIEALLEEMLKCV